MWRQTQRKAHTSSHKQEAESKQESVHSLQNHKALLQGHTLSHRPHLLSIPQTAASSFQTSEHLEDAFTEATTVPLAVTQSRYCALFGRQTEKPSTWEPFGIMMINKWLEKPPERKGGVERQTSVDLLTQRPLLLSRQ